MDQVDVAETTDTLERSNLDRVSQMAHSAVSARAGIHDDDASWPGGPERGALPGRQSCPEGDILCVGLIDSVRFSRECILRTLERVHRNLVVLDYATVQECVRAANQDFDLLVYHPHGTDSHESAMLRNVVSLRQVFREVPLVVMSDVEELDSGETIREALRSGARGFIPTRTTGIDVAVEAIRLVKVGGTFAPFDSFLRSRSDSSVAARETAPCEATLETFLTSRQIAVLGHLKQGKANKIIAHELSMSESTVKVHVRNIMRKLGATNRTQVAFKAQSFPGSGGFSAIRAP